MIVDGIRVLATVATVIAVILLLFRPRAGLVLFIATFPLNAWVPRSPIPALNAETIMIGLAIATTFLHVGTRLPPMRFTGPALAWLLVVVVGVAFAIPWARTAPPIVSGENALWTIVKLSKSMVFTTLIFFPVYWFADTPIWRRRMLEAASIAVLIGGGFAVIDAIVGFNPYRDDGERAMGLFSNPNEMSQYLGAMMLVSLHLLRSAELPRWRRGIHSLAYVLAWAGVVLSLSRGGWVATLVGHALYLGFINRRLLVVGILVMLVTATVAYPFLPSIVRDRIEGTTRSGPMLYSVPGAGNLDASTAKRLAFYYVGWDMFRESPIWGQGLYAFRMRTPEWGAKYGIMTGRDAHSLPVRLAAENGLLGLSVFAWLGLSVFGLGWRLWRQRGSESSLGPLVVGASATIFIANLATSGFLFLKSVSFFFWVLYCVAATATMSRDEDDVARTTPKPLPRWRRGVHPIGRT